MEGSGVLENMIKTEFAEGTMRIGKKHLPLVRELAERWNMIDGQKPSCATIVRRALLIAVHDLNRKAIDIIEAHVGKWGTSWEQALTTYIAILQIEQQSFEEMKRTAEQGCEKDGRPPRSENTTEPRLAPRL